MGRIYKAPEKTELKANEFSIFLGGSIEMDKAERWQDKLTQILLAKFNDIVIFNPRRDNWNSSLENKIENPVFDEQVSWEYEHLKKADIILIYFQPGTYSPISLLELGLFAKDNKVIVCCPEGYWRKGNVDFVCREFNIPVINNYEQIVDMIKYGH